MGVERETDVSAAWLRLASWSGGRTATGRSARPVTTASWGKPPMPAGPIGHAVPRIGCGTRPPGARHRHSGSGRSPAGVGPPAAASRRLIWRIASRTRPARHPASELYRSWFNPVVSRPLRNLASVYPLPASTAPRTSGARRDPSIYRHRRPGTTSSGATAGGVG